MEDTPLDAPSQVIESPKETLFNQIQVNDIVKREKEALAAKIRREMEEERVRAMEESSQSAPSTDMDSVYNQISSRVLADLKAKYESDMEANRNQRIVSDYFSKMNLGPEIYSDFQEVVGDFKPESFPEVAALAAEMDNTADVMYELAKNPSKLVEIQGIAKSDPNWARKRLASLSQSIAMNKQAAANNKSPNAPLSRINPSNLVGMDSGKASLSDLRKKYLKV